jgi:serine protease AprX
MLAAGLTLMTGLGMADARQAALDPSAPGMLVAFERLPEDAMARFASAGITHAAIFENLDAAAIIGPAEAYRAVAAWDGVVAMDPDATMRPYMWQAVETSRVDQVRLGAPPLDSPYTGEGVTVAVVDTGIDTTHPDLVGQVIGNYDFTPSWIFDPTKGQEEPLIREPVPAPVGVDGDHAHGTFVAGIVAGTGKAAVGPDDMRGVAPGAKLVNLDVASGGLVPVSSSMAAFDWILEHRSDHEYAGGIRVVVAGFGGSVDIPAQRAALNRLIEAGLIVVFPGGNIMFPDADDGDLTYPARYEEVIAVKAACKDGWKPEGEGPLEWTGLPSPDELDVPACGQDQVFQRHGGPTMDVVAPGYDVWTPHPPQWSWAGFYPLYRPQAPGGDDPLAQAHNSFWYSPFASHSLASAHVAGIAALMLEANPCLQQVQVERLLESTARDLGPEGFDAPSGYGMVDALAAVAGAEEARAAISC